MITSLLLQLKPLTLIQSLCLLFLCVLSFFTSADSAKKHVLGKAEQLQERLNNMMQYSASWLDNRVSDDSKGASANGYLQLSWIPRTADLADVDAKFKVYLNLPQWNERFSLILDNDNDDELILDYASDYLNSDDNEVNVAVQYMKSFTEDINVKNKIGISRSQLYLRSEFQYQWHTNNLMLSVKPRIDYFLQDGWGPGIKGALRYKLEDSQISVSTSWQKIQDENKSRLSFGAYYISSLSGYELLVSGVKYTKSNNKEDISNQVYTVSTRYRNLVYKSWMYFEIEPFIDFNEENDFRREVGLALSVISYYGK